MGAITTSHHMSTTSLTQYITHAPQLSLSCSVESGNGVVMADEAQERALVVKENFEMDKLTLKLVQVQGTCHCIPLAAYLNLGT